MRIVHMLWALEIGGAETMLVDIANEQVKTEDISIVVVNDKINTSLLNTIDSRCDVVILGRKPGSKNIWPWIKLNMFLLRWHPDIVHFHLEGMREMVLCYCPMVFTIHNMNTSSKEYHRYNALFAISDAVKNKTEQQGFKAITVHNGIHIDAIETKNRVRRAEPIRYKFVSVGRLYTPHKGQDVLIRALAQVNKGGCKDWHLDVIGDGESRMLLQELIHEKGLDEQITLLGSRDRTYLYNHLCDYDLFILPSRTEGFGLSVAEAMCAEIPVLISRLDGPMEVIDGGRLGRFFNPDDENDLANEISKFMQNGSDKTLLVEARNYAVEHFDIRRTAEKYLEEYKKILCR